MRSDRKILSLLCFLLAIGILGFAGLAQADQVPIGFVFYDAFEPGVNSFSINNFTGSASLPPDFSVVTPLNFLNATLTLTSPEALISLGTIGPGNFLDGFGNPLLVLRSIRPQFSLLLSFRALWT